MRYLTTLYVTDHQARLSARDGSLVVATDGRRSRVPIETLEAVVFSGHGQVTSSALALCADRGVRIAGLTRTGRLRYTAGGATSGNVLLRMAQFRAASDPGATLTLSRVLVAGKLGNASLMLQRWAWDAPVGMRRILTRLRRRVVERAEGLPDARDGDAVRGLEGDGTRAYFEGMRIHLSRLAPTLTFGDRSRRPPRDPVNAALSFVYGLVLAEVAGSVEAVGLDPQIGFLHGVRPGRPSLALDIIEEFRPSVADRFVVSVVGRSQLRADHFISTMGGACYLSDDGRRTLISLYDECKAGEVTHPLLDRVLPRGTLPLIQATLMARHLRGDLPTYPPFVMQR